MAAVIGTVPDQLTVTVSVGDQEPIAIGKGTIEVKVLGSAAVVTASSDTATTKTAVDTADARHELAQALRDLADQLDADRSTS